MIRLLTWPLHAHAAYTALVRWTCFNTIFLIFCIQAHNVRPFWREGARMQPIACSVRFACHMSACRGALACSCADADSQPGPKRSRMLRPGMGLGVMGQGKGQEPQDAAFGSTDSGSAEQHSRSRIWRSAVRMQKRKSRLPSLHRGHYQGAVIDAPWSYHAPKLLIWCDRSQFAPAQQGWCFISACMANACCCLLERALLMGAGAAWRSCSLCSSSTMLKDVRASPKSCMLLSHACSTCRLHTARWSSFREL